ncbi:hypothetical protein Tco_0996936, partial [Tanacetum coccineum]
MASGPNKRRAARKKKNKKKKKKNIRKQVFRIILQVKLGKKWLLRNEAVSEMCFPTDPTAMANPVLSDCVANGDQLSLESDLEALSLRLPVNPLHEQLNASSTIMPA